MILCLGLLLFQFLVNYVHELLLIGTKVLFSFIKLFRGINGISVQLLECVSGGFLLFKVELLTFPIDIIVVDHDVGHVFSSIRLVQDHHIGLLLIAGGSNCARPGQLRVDLSRICHIGVNDASLG